MGAGVFCFQPEQIFRDSHHAEREQSPSAPPPVYLSYELLKANDNKEEPISARNPFQNPVPLRHGVAPGGELSFPDQDPSW